MIENEGLGGAEMVLARVASELHAQGYPVLAIIGPEGCGWWEAAVGRGAGADHGVDVGVWLKMLRSLGRLRRIVGEEQVRTLVSWTFTTHLLSAARVRPERFLPNVRGLVYDWATPRRRMLWRAAIAPWAERILCVSRVAEEIVCECAPVARWKTVVIENGVDVAAFTGQDGAALRGRWGCRRGVPDRHGGAAASGEGAGGSGGGVGIAREERGAAARAGRGLRGRRKNARSW